MKRKFVFMTVFLLLVFILAGCKKATDGSETTATEDTVTEAATAGEASVDGADSKDTETKDAVSITTAPTAAPTAIPTVSPTQAAEETTTETAGTSTAYRDGVYEVQTKLDTERYYTKATVTIEGGLITAVDWCIYDSNQNDKPFDADYYHVFEGNDIYVQQAKDDWAGSRGYADALIETQDLDKVDAVTAATWANKKFKEGVKLALEQATAPLYKDGVYEVKTDPDYEKYYTQATVTIEGGVITAIDWSIYDVGHDKPFDELYYEVMKPYGDEYVEQAKKDWSGSREYGNVLIDTQDVDKVDAVSGATWTNKKFKEIVKLALEQAKK